MLRFRTLLLWLAFLLLLSQYFFNPDFSITLGIVYRLSPSMMLLLWFILSLLFRERIKIDKSETPAPAIQLLRIARSMAGLSIVTGALFKITHLPPAGAGNILLLTGIGLMAVYSSILSRYASLKTEQNPDILDDLEE